MVAVFQADLSGWQTEVAWPEVKLYGGAERRRSGERPGPCHSHTCTLPGSMAGALPGHPQVVRQLAPPRRRGILVSPAPALLFPTGALALRAGRALTAGLIFMPESDTRDENMFKVGDALFLEC